MAQWGNTDDAANSVIWGVSQLNQTANTDNRDALFGNTTADAYITNVTVGQYGVDAAEATASLGTIPHAGWVLRTEGSGGRAGRTHSEVLVAMGSMTGDATDDDQIPDYGIVIDTQPADTAVTAGALITLTAAARSVPTGGSLTYKWERATDLLPDTWVEITGATTPTDSGLTYSDFTTTALGIQTTGSNVDADGYRYRVTVTATGGTTDGVVSDVATITLTV